MHFHPHPHRAISQSYSAMRPQHDSCHPFIPPRTHTYLRNQHLVTGLHTRHNPLALLIHSARSHSQHLSLVELLDGAVREEETRRGFSLGLDTLDKDAVEEGDDAADGFDGGLFKCVRGSLGLRSNRICIN